MWTRSLNERLLKLASQFPAVLILGPRQVGKTTVAKMTFPDSDYLDLEDPLIQDLVTKDINYHLTKSQKKPVILDEAQVIPPVFSALRSIIDKNRKVNGQYIILGSAQPTLIRSISESLAGRVGVIEMSPLMMQEIQNFDYKTVWLKGGFPDALQGDFRSWWNAYLRTFIERDLKIWGIDTDPLLMNRILIMIAHQQGGILNSSELGRSLGVSYHTVNKYLNILEETFVIRKLQPFYKNIKKRLVKSPKVYIRDTGLLHHLLNINSIEELECHPIKGQSWETFVIEEIMRREEIINPYTRYYFWRTQVGAEIDLILERGGILSPIEIKSGMMVQAGHIKKLTEAMKDIEAKFAYIINQTQDQKQELDPSVSLIPFASDYHWLP